MNKKQIFLLSICFPLLLSCVPQTISYTSDKGIYQNGMNAYYSGKYNEAEDSFSRISEEFTNSAYQNFTYLALGDNHLRSKTNDSLQKSDAFYQIYLEQEIEQTYLPYVFENLIIIALKSNANQVFFPKLRSDKANSYFQDIIDDYYRFSLLYPDSSYFSEAKKYQQLAKNYLANHEFEVANWYFSKKLYYSAILRYNYLLKNYIGFSKEKEAFAKLVEAYENANLTARAKELQKFQ
jgi:outer membrane protein assembly factor BamD